MEDAISLINHRTTRRQAIANEAKALRTVYEDLPREARNKLIRRHINNERPPERATLKHLQRELADRLADITHARQNPPTHLPCGQDDAWYERLHAYALETKSLAKYLATQAGRRPDHDPLITPEQHARAGGDTCPYCLNDNTRITDAPRQLTSYALKIARECRECDHTYEVTYLCGLPDRGLLARGADLDLS